MSEAAALRDRFAASVPQSVADIETALKSGLLSLDANVLLNFYRFSPAARDALTDVLRAAGDRVWVSHQAAREFWRNRFSAIDSRDQASKQLRETLSKNLDSSESAVNSWAKQTAVTADAKQQIVAAISDGFTRALESIDKEVQGVGTVAYDATNDSVLRDLEGLLDSRIGEPLPPAEHEEALAEGERRAAEGIPPGFRDAEKSTTGSPDGASGDYLVWLQSVNEAVRRGLPLVIVTGDEKEDWWWRHRAALLGPRSELAEEFAQRSDQRLFMLRPVQLIEHASALDVTVSSEAVSDVERGSAEASSRWTLRAVTELLLRLEQEGREQADVIRAAAEQGGSIDREAIYELCGYREDRMLRGFTRPVARITKLLQEEGLAPGDVEPVLTPEYGGGVTAIRFRVPIEIVDLLAASDESSSAG